MNSDAQSRFDYSRQGGLDIHPESLAKIALSEIAKGSIDRKFFNTELTVSILDSILNSELEHSMNLIRAELEKGLSIDFFFEGVAPIIAEKLGDSWKQDELTFSQVTIAVSKLRLLCQELESRYFEPVSALRLGPKILPVSYTHLTLPTILLV